MHTFGLHLDVNGRDSDVSALAELSLAEERLTALQQQHQQRRESSAVATPASGARDLPEQSMQLEHIPAFLSRIRFRRALLKVRCRPAL